MLTFLIKGVGIIFKHKKTLSFAAAFILINCSVHAELIRTNSIDEYIDATTAFVCEADNDRYYSTFKISENNDFENRRLLLRSDSEFNYRNADTVIISPDGQYMLSFPTAQAAEEAYNYYISQGFSVIPDITLSVNETSAPAFYTPPLHHSYGPEFIHADEFNELLLQKYGSVENIPKIRVAVIDTGANYNHELLKGRVDVKAGYNFTDSTNTLDPLDDHGHGSHVSGIIADTTLTNVIIVPYKTMKSDGTGTVLSLTNAINKAISSDNIDIINVSLGSTDNSQSLCKYLTPDFEAAYDKGIISVAAAGNDKIDANYCCPANITAYTIAVSACDSTGAFASSYSNYGSAIDFCSPGTGICSSLHSGVSAYGNKSGTSMAAPSAASAFAMLKTYYPDCSVAMYERIMRNYAVDAGDKGYDNYYGYGYASMENLAASLKSAENPLASGYTATINNIPVLINTDNGSAVAVGASYDDNGILTGLEVKPISEECSITFENYSKIFIFDSFQSLNPLHTVITK